MVGSAGLSFLVPYFAYILSLLYRRAREGVPDAQLMLAPVAICYASWFAMIVLRVLNAYGQTWVSRDFGWFFQLSRWPFPFSFQDLADMVMLLAVMAVLPLRFARSRSDEERLASEMESARTVQQVLIPTEIPSVPGFDIQCVYRPAGHVGGDFFQIIPIASGGTLIVIGDVSGKGMPAAMTVSLPGGYLAHSRSLHTKSIGDSERHESAHAGAQPGRLHNLPGSSYRTGFHTDGCERRHALGALSARKGNWN